MSTVIDYPDSLSFSGNLKKFSVTAAAEVIFVLKKGETEILNENYQPDASGLLTIDVKAIVERLLEVTVPATSDQVTEQTSGVADFTASIDSTDINFRVIKGGVLELVETASSWLTGHFLTWQPQTKYTLQTQPEWLGIYPIENGDLVIKVFYTTGNYDATYASLLKDKLYSINVNFGVVAAWLAAAPQSQTQTFLAWDISYVVPGTGVTIPVHRYQLCHPSDAEFVYIWANSLGGIDSVSFTGYQEEDYKLQHLNALYEDETIFEYDTKQAREIRQSTGYLTDIERRWIADFFYSRTKYVLRSDGALKRIAVVSSKMISVNKDDEFDLEFTYRLTEDLQYLNLDILPASLPAPVDLDDFFLTSLLAGLPDATYASNLLMAVQSPYALGWRKLSLSQLWGGALPTLVDGTSIFYSRGKIRATGLGGNGGVDSITWQQIQDYIDSLAGNPIIDTSTKIISGAIIWQSGLNYRSTDIVYRILGTQYTALATLKMLEAADPNLSRIDLFYVDTFSNLQVATGIPAANPASPVLTSLQLEVMLVLIEPGALIPTGVDNIVVYDENLEWTTTETHDSDISVDFDSTDTAWNGNKRVKITLAIPDGITSISHMIGETYQGGKIFCLDSTGKMGYIAAESDTAMDQRWGYGFISVSGTSAAIGAGAANTALMQANPATRAYAVKPCVDLVVGGYDDWVLPSQLELAQMYARKMEIGNFINDAYWSSTQASSFNAFCIHFGSGTVYSRAKSNEYQVRAIRSFNDNLLPPLEPVTVYAVQNTAIKFTASAPVGIAGGILAFHIKSSIPWQRNSVLLIEAMLGSVVSGSVAMSPASYMFSYNHNNDEWAMVAIQIYHFIPSTVTVDAFRFSLLSDWPNLLELGLDDIRFQHGGVSTPEDVLANPGTYGSATQTLEITVNPQGKITAIQEHDIAEIAEAGILDYIAFEWWGITPGTIQVFDADIKATYDYTIEGIILETDNGTLTGVAVKIGALTVTALGNLTIGTSASETASQGLKTVVPGDRVTIVTSAGYSGTPTMFKGKLIIKKWVNFLLESSVTGTSQLVAIMANEDKDYDTGSSAKPKFIQVFDADGVALGFERSFSTTYKIKIFSTGTAQDAEVNIIY